MLAQSLVVSLIVLACAAYAAWTLMPAAARRAMAAALLKLSMPEMLARPFRKAMRSGSGCGGCDSCGDTAMPVKKVTVHRRVRH